MGHYFLNTVYQEYEFNIKFVKNRKKCLNDWNIFVITLKIFSLLLSVRFSDNLSMCMVYFSVCLFFCFLSVHVLFVKYFAPVGSVCPCYLQFFLGYGHIAPKTPVGKIVTIFYAILGIPITVICWSNIGDAMAKAFRLDIKKQNMVP